MKPSVAAGIEYYRNEIDQSEIFMIQRAEEYQSAYEKLKSDIYAYVSLTSRKAEEYNVEVLETLNRCIKYYRLDKGGFTSYFYKSLKKQIKKKTRDDIIDDRTCGMRLSENDRRSIADYYKREVKIDTKDSISEEMKRKNHVILEKWNLLSSGITSGLPEEEESRETFLLYGNSEESVQNACGVLIAEELLSVINDIFLTCNNRQKTILSFVLTVKLLPVCLEYDRLRSILSDLSFFNHKVLEWYQSKKRLPYQKEIAEYLGKPTSDISRVFTDYKKNSMKKSLRISYDFLSN